MSFLRAIFRVVAKLREHNPEIKYYCDPVLGDNGKLYVPEELVEVYRAEVRVEMVLKSSKLRSFSGFLHLEMIRWKEAVC